MVPHFERPPLPFRVSMTLFCGHPMAHSVYGRLRVQRRASEPEPRRRRRRRRWRRRRLKNDRRRLRREVRGRVNGQMAVRRAQSLNVRPIHVIINSNHPHSTPPPTPCPIPIRSCRFIQ